ncbi:porin [Hydrogenophaga sp. BPS33]|uniref:porin n=1 Tax=Hydrogenophaga sp. BPS33 TaxID=2651974 RepID=UPI001320111E|nr:porin [Hydrogenophaga sp. BPS33]QHE88230.1 porin [Hydrogenophaga sp. BPS33]
MDKTFQRSLLAGAVLSLAAVGAQAQSAVQIYGSIDMGLGSTKAPGGRSVTGVDSGKMTTSFYGFSGAEDLGGGLSAQFKIEGFFRGDTGAQGRFNGDATFARTTSVGLTHKDLGAINFGRTSTQLFVSTLLFNAFGDSFGYSPSIRHYFSSGAGSVTGDTGWNDSLSYSSPSFGGLRFGTSMSTKENAVGGVGNGGNWSVGLSYSGGPLAASLVHQSARKDAATPLEDTKTTQLGASYDFGVAKAFLQYGEIKNTTTQNRTDITGLGVRVPLGAGAFIAQYSSMDLRVGADRNTVSLGYVHNLSRRTDVYAVVMRDKLDGLSSGGGYSIGMRHRF